MISLTAKRKRALRSSLRCFAVLLLALAVIAPKISLALASVAGTGFQSVVICSGGVFVKVTLSPGGEIVEDVSTKWTSPHCVMPTGQTERLLRRWQAVSFGNNHSFVQTPVNVVLPCKSAELASIGSRGPPHA